jgi:hypothetical protein
MLIVALGAFILVADRMGHQWDMDQNMAEYHAWKEQANRVYADEANRAGGGEHRATRGEELAAYHKTLRQKYEHTMKRP